MALQNAHADLIAFAAYHCGKDLDHAHQDRRVSARVLLDHVEHRIGTPVIVDAGRDQDRLTRSEVEPIGQMPLVRPPKAVKFASLYYQTS